MSRKRLRIVGIAVALVAVTVGVVLGFYVFPSHGLQRVAHVSGFTASSTGPFRGGSAIIFFGSGTFDNQTTHITGTFVIGNQPINDTANQKEWGTWKATSLISYRTYAVMSSRDDEAGMLIIKVTLTSTNGTLITQDATMTVVCAMVPVTLLPPAVIRYSGVDYVTFTGTSFSFDKPILGANHFYPPSS